MDQGVLELVKNSYDADAMSCTVALANIEKPGGSIEIVDDGLGMTPNEIHDGWLVLGASGKEGLTHTKTLGRVPTGSKGLGRLACLRMGTKVTLVTRPVSEPTHKYTLEIDWNAYDNAKTVEEVELTIKRSTRSSKEGNGTRVTIQDLRKAVDRIDVERLARAMILLADPFGDLPNGFTPTLDTAEFRDLGKLVEKRYFEQADYRIVAHLRGGIPSAQITDWKGDPLHTAVAKDILPKDRKGKAYDSPDAMFELWVFKLSSEEYTNKPMRVTEVRNWLKQFGGVHVYVDTLRVPPYGNPGNDWLDMNLRRVRSPEERPATNTSIGRVRLSDSANELKQKTDRSGFIENIRFIELRNFAQDVLDWAARKRLAEAELRRGKERGEAPKSTRKTKKQLDEALQKVPKSQRKQLESVINAWQRSKDKEVDTLRREVELYRTLSTAGITAATFAHESTGNPLKAISVAINSIESRGKAALKTEYEKRLAPPVGIIRNALGSLTVLGMATLRLLEGAKRRVGRVEVHACIKNVIDVFKPFSEGRQVEVELQLTNGSPYFKGTDASIESIITNLLNNSLSAFESVTTRQRRIEVRTHLHEKTLVLEVLDNGPGIAGIETDEIWLPGYTTRSGGTGLGLTIVRDVAKDLGGSVSVEEHGSLGGATFRITLPILGA